MIRLKPIEQKNKINNESSESNNIIVLNKIQSKKQKQFVPHDEEHIDVGQYLKSAVYGGLDSVVNSLTIILGGVGSNSLPSHILAIGVAALIGDGLGMGLGDYLSAKAEKQFILHQQKRQLWEVKHKLLDQKSEIIEIYQEKGYTSEQAHRVADLYATNDQAFVNVMMLQQLGLVVDDSNPLIGGVITFFAFAIFGLLPFIPYVIGSGFIHDQTHQYTLAALIIGGVELFCLGFAKAMLIGLDMFNKIFNAFEMLLLGAIAVAVGFGIGKAFPNSG